MTDEMKFFLFLIERYARRKDAFTGDVLREWDAKGITQEIFGSYWIYHQEALENAFLDIDSLMATGEHLPLVQDPGSSPP